MNITLKSFLTFFILLIGTSSVLGQNEDYKRLSDSLTKLDKEFNLLLDKYKETPVEVDCYKEYFHVLKEMETDYYIEISNSLPKEKQKLIANEETKWKINADFFYGKNYRNFKDKHPDDSPLKPKPKAKNDAILLFKANADYVRKRINDLLELVKK